MIRAKISGPNNFFKMTYHETEELADAWIVANNPGGQGVVTEKLNLDPAPSALGTRLMKRSFGEKMIDQISLINDGKSLTTEQVDAFMSNALITNLREHLWAGNIATFIAKLTASDVSAFFSAGEKQAVLDQCSAFLTSLGE